MNKPRNGKHLNCIYCSKSFYIPKYRFGTSKFCSRSCQALHSRIKIIADCLVCGKTFEHISSRANKAKYCSRKCFHRSQIGKGNMEYKCFHCGITFMDHKGHNRKFCSRLCNSKTQRESWHPKYTTVRKKMLKEGLVDACARCGYSTVKEILGVHHKDRNRHNNKIENLEILCPNCHSLEHFKHISHGFKE